MKNFIRFGLILLLKKLVYTTQGSTFSLSLTTTSLTWPDAVRTCKNNGGQLASVDKTLGYTCNKKVLDIIGETDVWTANYLQESVNEADVYCGFNYLNNTLTYNSEVFYGPCDAIRNYFCKTSGQQTVAVFNSARSNVKCNETVSYYQIRSQIEPGFYWSNFNLKAIEVKGIGQLNGKTRYCGAYKRSIGNYFANCFSKRLSLCSTNDTSSSLVKAQTTASISAITCFEGNLEEKMGSNGGTGQKATSSIGVKIGVPIGIVLLLTCGILIILYIYRRRVKCWQSNNSKHENGRMNQFHTQETSPVHGQLNVNSESIQEIAISSEQNTNESNLTYVSAQYAVVKKPKKSDSKSRKDDNSIESYPKATNDEYDVTGRFQNCTSNPSDNLYNHFESVDEYNSTSFVRKGECDNLYNTTEDHNPVESTYASTTHVNSTTLPDDVYNHLT